MTIFPTNRFPFSETTVKRLVKKKIKFPEKSKSLFCDLEKNGEKFGLITLKNHINQKFILISSSPSLLQNHKSLTLS